MEVNHHTTSIIHTTLHDARVHGQHTPKAPTFRLQPIQPQPNLHEIQQPKRLVVPRGRHPPIIVSSTEQASHRSGERKGPPLKKKRNSLNSLGLRNKGDSVHASDDLTNYIYFYLIRDSSSIIKANL